MDEKPTQEEMKLGNYVVRRLIGRGGMGEVYLAEHPVLGKRVAAKILSADLSGSHQQVGRFQQEAVAACRIGHPAIVEVFDFGVLSDGRVYYLMEFLEGQNLAEYLQANGKVDPRQALQIMEPVMEALQAAHEVGIVHRDMKPENIFLATVKGEFRVKVLDFGIAKLLYDQGAPLITATHTGAILGTPLYMSPEQAEGKVKSIGPATDIYSTGVVLYTMLAGRPPFTGSSHIEVLIQHMQTPPPPIRNFNPRVPPELEQVVLKAMAKAPEARFSSMAEFLDAFRKAVLALPASGILPSPPVGAQPAAQPAAPTGTASSWGAQPTPAPPRGPSGVTGPAPGASMPPGPPAQSGTGPSGWGPAPSVGISQPNLPPAPALVGHPQPTPAATAPGPAQPAQSWPGPSTTSHAGRSSKALLLGGIFGGILLVAGLGFGLYWSGVLGHFTSHKASKGGSAAPEQHPRAQSTHPKEAAQPIHLDQQELQEVISHAKAVASGSIPKREAAAADQIVQSITKRANLLLLDGKYQAALPLTKQACLVLPREDLLRFHLRIACQAKNRTEALWAYEILKAIDAHKGLEEDLKFCSDNGMKVH